MMSSKALTDTARIPVADDKGLLAMNESNPTCDKRFAGLGIPRTAEARRHVKSKERLHGR